MKKFIFITLLSFSVSILSAQKEKPAEPTEPANKKNIIKLNLFALGLKNISVQYERVLSKRFSFAAGVRFMSKGDIPLKSTFQDLTDNPDTKKQIENITIGNTAFTPELRWYVGKKGAPQGFYIAPYARIAPYTASLPFLFDDGTVQKEINLAGDLNTFTGGILFGAQWKLGKSLMLDWWILGPNYGSSKGDIAGEKSLTASEQTALRNELANLDIPLTNITYTVDRNGATLNFKGPWAGVRSGLCLGFRF